MLPEKACEYGDQENGRSQSFRPQTFWRAGCWETGTSGSEGGSFAPWHGVIELYSQHTRGELPRTP